VGGAADAAADKASNAAAVKITRCDISNTPTVSLLAALRTLLVVECSSVLRADRTSMGRVRGRPSSPRLLQTQAAAQQRRLAIIMIRNADSRRRGCSWLAYRLRRNQYFTCNVAASDRRRCARHSTMKRSLLIFLVIAVTIVPSSRAKAADAHGRYFMVVRAYQSPDNDVVKAHTFVSFYRGEELSKTKSSPPTISWLPSSGNVHIFGAERGRNFSLAQTMAIARRGGREVKWWGPYEITPALYRSGLKRIQLLRSGRVTYSMLGAAPGSMNCIDAAGNLTHAPLNTGLLWGFAASSEVVHHFSPYIKRATRMAALQKARRSVYHAQADHPPVATSKPEATKNLAGLFQAKP